MVKIANFPTCGGASKIIPANCQQGCDFRSQLEIFSSWATFGESEIPTYSPHDPHLFLEKWGTLKNQTFFGNFLHFRWISDSMRSWPSDIASSLCQKVDPQLELSWKTFVTLAKKYAQVENLFEIVESFTQFAWFCSVYKPPKFEVTLAVKGKTGWSDPHVSPPVSRFILGVPHMFPTCFCLCRVCIPTNRKQVGMMWGCKLCIDRSMWGTCGELPKWTGK